MNKTVVSSIVVAVAITAVLVSVMVSLDAPGDQPDWQFDDYKIIDGATAASGSLELVEVGGKSYVHAHSLGAGTITTNDGVQTVHVARAHLDVFLMTGQSNAAYWTAGEGDLSALDPSKADPVPAPGTAYYYGFADRYDRLTVGTPEFLSMTTADGAAAIGDKAPPFAGTYTQLTGHKTYWICGAVSGTTIDQFVPGTGDVWSYMEQVVPAAMDAIDETLYIPHVKGYMWIQGEWNSSTSIDEYKVDFMKMHEEILDGDLGVRFDHCFISLVGYGNAVTAQRELARDHPSTITLSTEAATTFTADNGLLGNGVHYSQEGDNIIGVDLGVSCAEYYQKEEAGVVGDLAGLVPVLIVVSLMAFIVLVFIRRY